jgi:hypothetical protein
MQTDRPGPSSEEFSVRLSWPKAEGEARGRGAAPAPPGGGGATPSGPGSGEPTHATEAGEPAGPAAPEEERPAPPTASVPVRTTPVTEVLAPGGDGTRLSRAFVEAFDRLSDRLLDRIRSLRQDVDADLASVRAELAALRQAVDEAGDQAPLRQLKAAVEEVREDVVGLRRAVLEWPALEQVAEDVAAIRGDLAFLFETSEDGSPAAAPSELLGELRGVVQRFGDEVDRLANEQPQMGGLAPLLEEVAAMREELTSVRRRLVLRASPLDDEQLERLVDAVASRVVDELRSGERRAKRR